MGRITLHPEHGVNPIIQVCFWCHETMGVVLLGNRPKPAEREAVLNYEPCDHCIEQRAKGFTCIEVTSGNSSDPRPDIAPGLKPTGNWWVIKSDTPQLCLIDPITAKELFDV